MWRSLMEVFISMLKSMHMAKPRGGVPPEFYVAKERLPDNMAGTYIALATGPDIGENSAEFPATAFALIERLLAGRQVLTEIDRIPSSADTAKKGAPHWEESRFPKSYYEFLCAHEMADDAHFCEPDKLLTKTTGINAPVTKILFFYRDDIGGYQAYAYPTLPDFSDFDGAKAHIENTPYSLLVEYERYPDTVRIIANPEKISLEYLVTIIKDVCESKNIPLRIDQSVFTES